MIDEWETTDKNERMSQRGKKEKQAAIAVYLKGN